jgi:hypothetical protein
MITPGLFDEQMKRPSVKIYKISLKKKSYIILMVH